MMLYINMVPSLTVDYFEDARFHNSVNAGKFKERDAKFMQADHSSDIEFSDFCSAIVFASTGIVALFSRSIAHIVALCPKEKMLRIAARWVVTAVQNLKTLRNGTVRQYPRNPVGRRCFPLVIDLPISRRNAATSPFPAIIFVGSLANGVPEVANRGLDKCHSAAPGMSIVYFAEPASMCFSTATVFGTNLAASGTASYRVGSHIERPSRVGQRRRTVSSGRRLVFMAQNLAKSQHVSGGAA